MPIQHSLESIVNKLQSLGIELTNESETFLLDELDEPQEVDLENTEVVEELVLEAIEPQTEAKTTEDLSTHLIKCYCEKVALVHILTAMHTNTAGRSFYQDHLFYETLAKDQQAGLDRLAENIRTYGVIIPAGIKSIAAISEIETSTTYDAYQPEGYFTYLYQVYELFIDCLSDCYMTAETEGKYGTANILQDEIELCEKHLLYFVNSVIG